MREEKSTLIADFRENTLNSPLIYWKNNIPRMERGNKVNRIAAQNNSIKSFLSLKHPGKGRETGNIHFPNQPQDY